MHHVCARHEAPGSPVTTAASAVFSLDPRCQGEWQSHKKTGASSDAVIER